MWGQEDVQCFTGGCKEQKHIWAERNDVNFPNTCKTGQYQQGNNQPYLHENLQFCGLVICITIRIWQFTKKLKDNERPRDCIESPFQNLSQYFPKFPNFT